MYITPPRKRRSFPGAGGGEWSFQTTATGQAEAQRHREPTGSSECLSVAAGDDSGEAEQIFRSFVNCVEGLDFILRAMREPGKRGGGGDTLKTHVLGLSQLVEKVPNSQRGIYRARKGC